MSRSLRSPPVKPCLDDDRHEPYSEVMRAAAIKRFRAWLLLATFVTSLGSSGLNLDHLDIIDSACGEVGLAAGSDAARLANPTDTGAQHCPVCHYLRAVSGANVSAQARLAVQNGLTFEFAATTQIPPSVDAITRSSRGPPASTLTIFI